MVDTLWQRDGVDFSGHYYQLQSTTLQPKPLTQPRPTIYAGGESEAAKSLIARRCDAYVMHGDPPEKIQPKIEDMERRRRELNLPPMQYGVAAYCNCEKHR